MSANNNDPSNKKDADPTDAVIDALRSSVGSAQMDLLNERLKDAKVPLWHAIDAIRDGFALFDEKHRLVAANGTFRKTFERVGAYRPGTTYADLAQHMMDHNLILTEDLTPDEWLAQFVGRLESAAPEPIVIHLRTGQSLRIQDSYTDTGHLVSLSINVTREMQIELELRRANQKAEAANSAKSAFLANMSHEIRTPMNGVVGMADLLADTELTEEQRLYVDTIKSSGEALLVIINDVLDYSKIEADKMVLHPEPFDLERTIHELIMLMQPAAREKGIDLLVDYDIFLPTQLVGDPGRIRQILTNLVGNAVKFTTQGYVLVRVVGIEMEDSVASIHITVKDTGIGIPEEKVSHIFGEFNQVEDEAHHEIEGTGLGLAITKKLVRMMYGEVWVDSEVGKGSCFGFQVVMPVVAGVPDQTPSLPENLKTAMLVDDLEINRQILQKQLSVLGVDCVSCASGREALSQFDPGIDLVLTDHLMPDMDGLELAQKIRAKDSDVPVILLSSNLSFAQADPGKRHLTAMLQKPIPRGALFSKLQSLGASVVDSKPVLPHLPAAIARADGIRQMRVLVAEDNKTNQLVFEKVVKALNLDLRFADDGMEAVELEASFKPDLVFMDVSMPRMDGIQATAMIRQSEDLHAEPVPIVAITGHSFTPEEVDTALPGMDGYLTKPLKKAEIIQIIEHLQPDDTFSLMPQMRSGTDG